MICKKNDFLFYMVFLFIVFFYIYDVSMCVDSEEL